MEDPMRRHLVLTAVAITALALGACGKPVDDGLASANNGSAPGAEPTPTSTLSPQEKALKFAQCMRDNGVPMEDPDVSSGGGMGVRIGGEGVDEKKLQAAMQACREFSPMGEGGRAQLDPQMEENMRKFSQCMRDNGVEKFPDADGGGLMIDRDIANDPDFPAAQEKCAKQFLPDLGGGPGTI
jgi:hypothetical protein